MEKFSTNGSPVVLLTQEPNNEGHANPKYTTSKMARGLWTAVLTGSLINSLISGTAATFSETLL
ncbi:MAG: hypothetical protein PSV13_21570 [Lacunisphaera sp.]|nr:hypothetical protein [Lacunisphaera sp.]